MYKCVVSNRFGGSSASGRLVVRRSTRITSGPLWVGRYALQKTTENGTIITSIGNEVTLFCRAETDPLELSKLLIKWQWLPLAKLPNSQLDRETDSANGYSELPSDAIRETQRKISRSSIESSLTLLKPLPSHSGTFKCQAISSLDNDSKNVDVIIQGPPSSPIDISIDCTQAAKRGTALLSWTSGSENNAPITDVQIEYMVGYIRPIAKFPSEISLSNGLHTSLDSRAIFEALNASLMRNEWQVLKHSLVSGDRYSSALWKIDKSNTAVVNLTGRVALIPIYPDVAYQFRLRLINRVGVSNPSPLAPGLNEEEQIRCLLKPQAPTVNPDDLEIYGNVPNTLTVTWKVSLIASNTLGLSKAGPTISTGWSAEYPPTIAPHKLRATRVDSSTAELVWDWPTTDSIAVNGFFVGLRLEWCLAEKGQMCDRYKVTQDVRIAEPSKELYPHLRINPSESDSTNSKDFSHPNVTDNRLLKSNFLSYSQHRQAVLKDLPGLSQLRVWVRVLNIQYEGPSSEILIIHTKEGVPEEVSEFTHSFAGVNYVEVSWTKPTQTNGILTGYLIDVLSDKEDCVKKDEGCEFTLYEKKISDPDQMATRIGGLKISTSYTLRISALTAVGPGKPRELKVHTAKLKPAKSPAEFVVSPVYGSTNTLNVSLIRPLEASNTLNDENRHSLLQRDDALLEPGSSSLIKNTGPDGLRAFLVQFKRLQDEHWEETEKEFDKVWQIVGNLIPGEEYDMRVILAQSPSVSYVSPVRMLRVPRPGEIGFGLSGGVSTTLRENSQGSIGSGGVFGDASLVLKIFVPLAVTLFLIALIFTSVCCLRGPMFRQPMPRRLRTPKPTPSSLVAQRLNGCRVADENFISKKRQQCWFDTSGMNQYKQQDHVQQSSTSTFAPTRCLSPSFTLVPPMENPTPWQRATTTKETFASDRPS
ncbi:unnamed protein product [Hymenolepis diminuta]|uniref:Fibronectin type-III domain-containing protein n=1 Tax=Hymenolepis diminuta TaxID=6216 RepID=A0A0R3SVN3_HYMDI|nr:unnamed protein product [Hymenolepis diminuta]